MSRRAEMRALATFTIAAMLLTALLMVQLGYAQTTDLQLKVVDYNGNPVGNVEVVLTNSTLRRTFRSTSAGIATFRGLSPGEYNVQVSIDGVLVANETVRVPHEGERIVRLAVASLAVKVLDAEGRGAKGVTVQVRSSTGKIERSATTSDEGSSSFSNLPLSTLRDVGSYNVTVRVMNATVLSVNVDHAPLNRTLELIAPLVRLGFEVLDLGGEPVNDVELRISASGVLFSSTVRDGKAAFSGVPTSSVVGSYQVVASKTYSGRKLTVLSSTLSVSESVNTTLVANVADLQALLLADGEDPVRGAAVTVVSTSGVRIATGTTDASGRVVFEDLPVSSLTEVGPLEVRVSLQGKSLLNSTVQLTGPIEDLKLELRRRDVSIRLVKPDGSPLEGATMELTEPGTNRKVSVGTGADGVARFRVLPVRAQVSVLYKGILVHSETLDFSSAPEALRVNGVSMPVNLEYRDWTGAPLRGLRARVWYEGQELPVEVRDGTVSFVMPVRGTAIVEVSLGGQFLERRELKIDEPTNLTIYVRGLQVGGDVVPPEVIGTAGAVALSAVLLALGVLIYVRTVKSLRRS
ncbi:MAG: carboxypeptidase regulatory-like domain-containing protein [Aigarchaeota archaeon]|nr:carboxypeptidase regulatory-like domain-containing protein [Candidatus Calditenuis fumarioli]